MDTTIRNFRRCLGRSGFERGRKRRIHHATNGQSTARGAVRTQLYYHYFHQEKLRRFVIAKGEVGHSGIPDKLEVNLRSRRGKKRGPHAFSLVTITPAHV